MGALPPYEMASNPGAIFLSVPHSVFVSPSVVALTTDTSSGLTPVTATPVGASPTDQPEGSTGLYRKQDSEKSRS